jgi:[CysO sulfur-carrier protein]-S-L-cysteine hydrolase
MVKSWRALRLEATTFTPVLDIGAKGSEEAPARDEGFGLGTLPGRMLRLTDLTYAQMVALAYEGLPLEACGLLGGDPATGKVDVFYPCHNAAQSSRVYTVDPRDHLRADRDAEARGLEIIGVMHSHTHTEAYPSPTDVEQAPDPGWHYVIVSLKREAPVLRSFRLVDGSVTEEPVELLRA